LLAGHAAADGVEVESYVLRSPNRSPQILAEEGRDLDPSFFHVEDHRPASGQFLRG
jgi:hypothetical protein